MRKKTRLKLLYIALPMVFASCGDIEPYGPLPTESQVEWQRMEMNMFCHFGPNTFSGAEWGDGNEEADIFAPSALEPAQWVTLARDAGFRGIILTAKHHDGFCLWPSSQSNHTVAQSRWMDGVGDVLAELRHAIDSIAPSEVKMGVYISPWDRNHPAYGTDIYNDIYDSTLCEVHRLYGPMFEQWFDGACGEGPNGRRQHYDWSRFFATMGEIAPQAVLFSDIGPGCRWVGNEDGKAPATCWSTLDTTGSTPSENKPSPETLASGNHPGEAWVPAEVDVSIRPGWFWHAGEEPKSVEQLVDIYFNSVGHNSLLLLNVPPDTSGRIPYADSLRLMEFRAELDRIFSHNLAYRATIQGRHKHGHPASDALDDDFHTFFAARDDSASLTIIFDSVTTFDIIALQEYIPLGQRVTNVSFYTAENPTPQQLCTTVGYKRLVRLPQELGIDSIRTRCLTLHFRAEAAPLINHIAIYNSRYDEK